MGKQLNCSNGAFIYLPVVHMRWGCISLSW